MLMNALLDQTVMSTHLVSTQMDPMFALASLLTQEMVKNVQVWGKKNPGSLSKTLISQYLPSSCQTIIDI